MPTLLRIDGFRFFFFSDEHTPLHVHVEKGDAYLRIELETFSITESIGFSSKEIRKINKIVQEHQQDFIGAWNDYFN